MNGDLWVRVPRSGKEDASARIMATCGTGHRTERVESYKVAGQHSTNGNPKELPVKKKTRS